jgi:ABC-type bacteriocin/lantibiotic exporter with double-glycine peptidase domain
MIKFILDDVVVSQDLGLLQSTVTGLLLALLAMPLMTHLQERA